jgi:putative endonuclease
MLKTLKRDQGKWAEALALAWLERHGYELIESNYNRRIGEIDLIVRHPDQRTIVFVEVRYRSRQQFGSALESVDHRKQKRLKRTANAWLQRRTDSLTPARMDVIALSPASPETPPDRLWHSHELVWVISAIEE